jgi:hypothetical protein
VEDNIASADSNDADPSGIGLSHDPACAAWAKCAARSPSPTKDMMWAAAIASGA